MKTITIRRQGTFAVGWQHSHSHQCGHYGDNILSFDVTIKGKDEDCSPEGWLCDNNDIPSYFKHTYTHVRDFVSCEDIARKACEAFKVICNRYGAKPSYIRVSVTGIEHSEIVCEWEV